MSVWRYLGAGKTIRGGSDKKERRGKAKSRGVEERIKKSRKGKAKSRGVEAAI